MNSRDDLGTTRRTEWVSKPGSYIMRNDERTDRCDIGAPGPMFHVQLNDSEFHGAGYCGDTPPDSGEWHHYVGVFDSDSRGVEFWEDGQRIHANRSVTGMTIQNSTEPLTIGAHQAGTNYFNGSIDQVRIYNRSLSAAEIWHLYSQGMYRKNTEHVAGPKAWWRFDGGPEVCILNEQNLQPGGWQAPSPSDLKSLLTDAGWTAQYVTTDDITQDRWTACDVIVFPNGEDYPAFDTSSDFCNGVNGEGTEHDIFAEMKEFVADGGLFVGTWGAGMWYPHAKNASGWQRYADDCSQYSGDSLYSNGGGSRCSDLGYSCYSDGDYEYGNINQGITPALPGTITDVDYNYRWASGLDINLLQAYNATSGSTISGKYVGLQRHGDGWWFHPGSNRLMDPGQSSYATDLWNNLLTWYAGGGEQRMFDDGPTGNPVSIQGDNNSVAYATDCVQGSCIDFSGSEDFLKSTNGVAMAPTDNSSFSMAAWIKTGQDGAIVGKTNDAFADGSSDSNIFLRTDSGTPTWQLEYNSSNDEDTLTGSTTVTDNNWHHVVGVRDGWNFTIYVDGEQDAHFTKSDYYVDDGYREYNTALNPDAAVDIGHYREQSTFFPGQIDDVRIYPYALTEAQVQTVMQDSAARFG